MHKTYIKIIIINSRSLNKIESCTRRRADIAVRIDNDIMSLRCYYICSDENNISIRLFFPVLEIFHYNVVTDIHGFRIFLFIFFPPKTSLRGRIHDKPSKE